MKINGATLTDKTTKMLVMQILSDIRNATSSQGVIAFHDHDYIVSIQRVPKRKPSWLQRLLKKGS